MSILVSIAISQGNREKECVRDRKKESKKIQRQKGREILKKRNKEQKE